jgi:Protein of unknown function (DUF3631)
MQTAVAQLLAKYGIKLASTAPGRHYTTCPKCSAGRASKEHRTAKVLGVTIEADGKVHWGCNHCQWTGPEKGSGTRQELQAYIYRDDAGAPRFRKVRNLPGHDPRFWLERADGRGGWIKGLTKDINSKILYRADELAKAVSASRIVACVEGEKDADNLWSIGIAATCNAHGASEPGKRPKWTKAHSEQLVGADIVVLNDNDAAGYAHADATCKLSLSIAKRVRRLDLAKHWPDMPKGADVSGWLAAGHTGKELAALIEQAPDYEPPPGAKEKAPPSGSNGIDDAAELEQLARLAPLDYERARKDAGKRLGISRLSLLDALVKAKRAELGLDESDGKQGHAIAFPQPEPWPEPVDGAALLDDLAEAIRRHVVMSDAARDEAALWVVHAYMIDSFLFSPRLGVTSPVKGCGKTTLLDVLGRCVPRPLPTANVTPAALFRVVEGYRPTLLVDEADSFLHDNDELRGVLNSGHRKGGTVLRTVGDDHEPRAFNTFCPTVIALIGHLPDTLNDRAVTIDLKRRLRSEDVQPYRPDRADHLDALARKAARWAKDHAERVAATDPEMPDGIINRMADNWRPLLAIADAADGGWPERARKATSAARAAAADDEASRLELLLRDIRETFDARRAAKPPFDNPDEIPSKDLVEHLVGVEGRPWCEMGRSRKPMTQNRLARMLKPLGITPGNVGPEDAPVRGYERDRFKEAFDRYLDPTEGGSKCTGAQNAANTGTSDVFKVHSQESGCAVVKREKSNNDGLLGGCAVVKGGSGGKARARAARPKSDDLPYDGPVVAVPDLGPEPRDEHSSPTPLIPPGLSARSIEALAGWYTDRAYANAQETGGDTRTAELDAALRQRLVDEGILREHVETEFERMKMVVFRA